MSKTDKKTVRLTDQLERFAQGVAGGMTRSAALRAAYPLTVPKWAPDAVWNRASALMRDSQVLARVEELRAEIVQQNLWSRIQSARALIEVIDAPDKKSDVINAVKVLNEMHGYNAPIVVNHDGAVTMITRRIIGPEKIGAEKS